MKSYLPLYIKVSEEVGGAYSKSIKYQPPFDTRASYGLWIKHAPFPLLPKNKQLVTQSWKDEDGDDVFLSELGVKSEAYDWKLTFVYLWNDGLAHVRIADFINRINGRWLKIHDSYTKQTRDAVYVLQFDPEPKVLRRGSKDYFEFDVTFRVNNPSFKEVF